MTKMITTIEVYRQHISHLQKLTANALAREGLSTLVIDGGALTMRFLDDNAYPFAVNPHFKQWCPIIETPNCWLLVDGQQKPTLLYYLPVDFWHKVEPLPTAEWTEAFNIIAIRNMAEAEQHLPQHKNTVAYIGERTQYAKELGFTHINPVKLVDYLHFYRAMKTDYELACLRQATQIAVQGHQAAQQAFHNDLSEFDIHLAYLAATRLRDDQLPYSNIVALNEHAAILHYTALDTARPANCDSFLIDAGASYHGYAADITRTYTQGTGVFADLISGVDQLTLACAQLLEPGRQYGDIHHEAHVGIAQLLQESGLVDLSIDEMVATQVTRTFFPHGIGHLLGLQVHDVGGYMADHDGLTATAPAAHPYLRSNRTLATGMVYTIEPGLYFIDSLLAELKQSKQAPQINWALVDELRPYGGIRVEDNVVVHADRVENMTRAAGLS